MRMGKMGRRSRVRGVWGMRIVRVMKSIWVIRGMKAMEVGWEKGVNRRKGRGWWEADDGYTLVWEGWIKEGGFMAFRRWNYSLPW
jgi:hypothetical protein